MLDVSRTPDRGTTGDSTGVALREQTQVTGAPDINMATYRVLSANPVNWYDGAATVDPAERGEHVGWFFNLPGNGERMVTDLFVRDGVLRFISSQPSDASCAAGTVSVIHAIDACTGGSLTEPFFDVNGDGVINSQDMINIGSGDNPVMAVPAGIYVQGMAYTPATIAIPTTGTAVDISSLSTADLKVTRTKEERHGVVNWREIE
jgi:type IV pilus assembly protein PilY1